MTAATVHSNLRAASRQHLLAMPGLPTLTDGSPAVVWEGKSFTDEGTPFIRESFRPISSTLKSVGSGSTIEHRINLLWTLSYPSDDGTVAIEDMAGSLLAHFAPQTRLSYGTDGGLVIAAERRPILTEPKWLSLIVAITILSYTTN
jgi:hypothetical protein